MDLISRIDGFRDPDELIRFADSLSDPPALVQLLDHVSSHDENKWRIPEAYLLWRLKYFDRLLTFLNSLPSTFHSNPQYFLFLGLAWSSTPDGSLKAAAAYRSAINLSPDQPDLYYNLANIQQKYDLSESASLYKRSLCIDSMQSHVWHNYGRLQLKIRNYDLALIYFQRSLLINPLNADVLCDLGLTLMKFNRYHSAERAFVHAISLDSTLFSCHVNLAVLLLSLRRPEEASSFFEQSISLEPSSSLSLFNLGLCHLLMGKYSTGWEYYEERLKLDIVPPLSHPVHGKVVQSFKELQLLDDSPLIVWSEQGLGDAIMFCRYLLILDSLDINYEFHCHSELVSLITLWLRPKCVVHKLVLYGHPDDQRTHCPLLSLPRIFDTCELTIPSSLPYLTPPSLDIPPHLSVSKPPGGLSVGLVWASNPDNSIMYQNKSIPLELLMPLLVELADLDLITIHSLQVGTDQSQLSPWVEHPSVTDWSTVVNDFADTAHVVHQLDLVITVDTAVAHLSAALQKPTWILLPWDSDFRWLCDRSDSPWYPNVVRLFRQSDRSDWNGVIISLRNALNRLFLVDIHALASSVLF